MPGGRVLSSGRGRNGPRGRRPLVVPGIARRRVRARCGSAGRPRPGRLPRRTRPEGGGDRREREGRRQRCEGWRAESSGPRVVGSGRTASVRFGSARFSSGRGESARGDPACTHRSSDRSRWRGGCSRGDPATVGSSRRPARRDAYPTSTPARSPTNNSGAKIAARSPSHSASEAPSRRTAGGNPRLDSGADCGGVVVITLEGRGATHLSVI